MKRIILLLAGIVVAVTIVYMARKDQDAVNEPVEDRDVAPVAEEVVSEPRAEHDVVPNATVLLQDLEVPWDVIFLEDGTMLISERTGIVVHFDPEKQSTTDIAIDGVSDRGEGGLLGMIAHPEFAQNKYIYMYLTSTLSEDPNASVNQVVRYTFDANRFSERKVIFDAIPGSLYHNGGRLAFGPDGYLYITTGDARVPDGAQNKDSLAGKILRLTDEGDIPSDNPFGTAVYAYGSRNAQGLAWDEAGNLWSTEHGRTSATETGMDEINRIVPGGNYGWPESEGDRVISGTIAPVLHSGARTTWAPASALFYDGSLFFGGLRGEALYEAVLRGDRVIELKEHFKNTYGRIRTVTLGPDGMMYLLTSNRDGRGSPSSGDDRLIRINPAQFR